MMTKSREGHHSVTAECGPMCVQRGHLGHIAGSEQNRLEKQA